MHNPGDVDCQAVVPGEPHYKLECGGADGRALAPDDASPHGNPLRNRPRRESGGKNWCPHNRAIEAALGGTYPASSLYVQAMWADSHKADAAKLAHAFVRTMQFIHTHSAEEIAAKMPDDYQKDKPLYVSALKASLPMYTVDGKMPTDGPATVLKVLAAFNPSVKGKRIELGKTYTNEFVSSK